jgi:urease accessory protein
MEPTVLNQKEMNMTAQPITMLDTATRTKRVPIDESRLISLMSAIQLEDNALPIGRFVHSNGLESWLQEHPEANYADLKDLIEGYLISSYAPLDAAAMAAAHEARTNSELHAIDRVVTAAKLTAPARSASESCGQQLASLARDLCAGELQVSYISDVVEGLTPGNLSVIEGTMAKGMGVTVADTVASTVRGAAANLMSAAIRMGRLRPKEAQRMLVEMTPTLLLAIHVAMNTPLDGIHSSASALEIAAMRHMGRDSRLFST